MSKNSGLEPKLTAKITAKLTAKLKLFVAVFSVFCFYSCGIKGKPLPPIDNDQITPVVSAPQKIKNGN